MTKSSETCSLCTKCLMHSVTQADLIGHKPDTCKKNIYNSILFVFKRINWAGDVSKYYRRTFETIILLFRYFKLESKSHLITSYGRLINRSYANGTHWLLPYVRSNKQIVYSHIDDVIEACKLYHSPETKKKTKLIEKSTDFDTSQTSLRIIRFQDHPPRRRLLRWKYDDFRFRRTTFTRV